MFGNEGQDAAAAHALAADQGLFAQRLFAATPRAWVTQLVVVANVVIFAAMLADGAGLFEANSAVHLRWGANFGPITKDGEWWRLLACTFLHFGLVHLAMNMWALWGAGGLVERLYGNLAFLAIYLFAGLTGSFASLYWNADKVVSVGASGAIFGVYGALAAYVLREPGSVPKSVLKSLTNSTIAFIGYSIFLGVMVSAIDNAAHAGGLAGGFALAWVLARPLAPRAPLGAGRAAAAAAVAGISVAALFALLPPPRYSYAAQKAATEAIQSFAGEEASLAGTAQALVEDRRAGRITDRQLGEAIEKQLLPGWTAAHARFAAIRLEPGAPAAAKVAELTEFVRVRRDMFAAYADGLRTGDAARMRRAEELSGEAQAMMKAMRERAK
ncbi:MAG: rhomboid family intramembrane serine protease [Proteobacteria bacterium]|nr:rhomboid family intramembrane serine protease [Pseudomonadota bacterium]